MKETVANIHFKLLVVILKKNAFEGFSVLTLNEWVHIYFNDSTKINENENVEAIGLKTWLGG